MALTYSQLDALTANASFLARVRQAVAHHAEYWQSNANATPAQLQWCEQVFINLRLAQIAANLMNELVQDVAVTGSSTGDGSDITDAALQTAADKICEKYH